MVNMLHLAQDYLEALVVVDQEQELDQVTDKEVFLLKTRQELRIILHKVLQLMETLVVGPSRVIGMEQVAAVQAHLVWDMEDQVRMIMRHPERIREEMEAAVSNVLLKMVDLL